MTFTFNKSTVNRLVQTFNTDKGAAKIIDEIKGNDNVNFNAVEDSKKDDKLTTLKLIQAKNAKDTKIEVVVNVDDIKRKAKETGVNEDVFLSQQIASVMSASYLMLDAIKDGKDPSKYLTNAEFLVASNLLADGMVRRTNKAAIPYLDKERANMAARIKAEHGDVETDSSDAFERADALGFKGINTGGWGDKIVHGFGDLPDLDELDETTKAEEDDKVAEADDTEETDDNTEVANNDDDTTTDKTDDNDTKDKKEKEGFNWGNLLLGGLGGFLLAKVMSPDKSANVKKETDLKLAQQQEQFQLILAQREAQTKAVLLQQEAQQKAQAKYQLEMANYQAQVAAANTASSYTPTAYSYPAPGTYTMASTPVVYSTTSSTTPTSYVVPTVPAKSDWT